MIDVSDSLKIYEDKKIEGQEGKIRLVLQSDKFSKTYIKELEVKSPLLVQKAVYPDITLPNMAYLYLMSSSGGILQGDELNVDIRAGPGTLSHFTNQAATKIYKTENSLALQNVSISLEKNSYMEFIPNQIIPYKLSRFNQVVSLKVDRSSTMVYSEIISAGRIAFGEKFDFDLCFMKLSTFDENNNLLFRDFIKMDSKNKDDFHFLFGGRSIWSTIYVINNNRNSEEICSKILSMRGDSSVFSGFTYLPNNAGIMIRMLSNSMDKIVVLTNLITAIVREHRKL